MPGINTLKEIIDYGINDLKFDADHFLSIFKFLKYVFGCVWSLVADTALSLGSLIAEHGLSGCGRWAPECTGSVVVAPRSVAPQPVGSQFPDQGLNHVPCITRQVFNHWVAREVPVSSIWGLQV